MRSSFLICVFVALLGLSFGAELIGGPCQSSSDCSNNSECSLAGDCSCPPQTIANFAMDRCLSVIDQLHQSCEEDQQCQVGEPGKHSHCSEGRCECVSSATVPLESHKCYPKAVKDGDACEVDAQCVTSLGLARCSNEKCECYEGYVPSEDRSRCVQKKNLGESCTDSGQCRAIASAASAGCLPAGNGHTCQCNEGYESPPGVPNECYKKAVLVGDSCSNHEHQCNGLPLTYCYYGSCRCEETHVSSVDKTRCLPKVEKLNETCEESAQCVNSNVGCKDGVCDCNTDYTPSVDKPESCVLIARNFLYSCSEDVQCTTWLGDGTYCYLNRCICVNTHVFRMSCQPRRDGAWLLEDTSGVAMEELEKLVEKK